MLTFFLIPDTKRFLTLVNKSCGDVLLNLPDGTKCSLKRDHTARQMLRAMRPGQNGISISISNPGDAPTFLRYMMEAALLK